MDDADYVCPKCLSMSLKEYSRLHIVFVVLFFTVSSAAIAQQAEWIKKPKQQWPQIAMINEVWYKNIKIRKL